MKNICFVMQNQYCKIGHAMARTLKEHHGVERFSAYVFSPGAAAFLREQTDIRYEPMLVDHELHARMKDGPVDHAYIARYEAAYGPLASPSGPGVWQYLYCDRKLMMSIGPKEETTAVIDPLYPHEGLMRAFQVRAQAIERMLTEHRPDAIFFFAIGTVGHLILFHVAKKIGIQTLNIDFPRVSNRMCVSEDYRTLSTVEDAFREFQKNNAHTPSHEEAEKLINRFRTTGSLDLQYMDLAVGQLPKKHAILNPTKLLRSLGYLRTLTKNYWQHRDLFLYGATDENPLRFVGHKLKQRYRMMRGIEDFYSPPDYNEPFVYFPLHYEPELAILLLSPFYFDQIELIKYIARSVPLDYTVYVKEHPAMVSKRARSYYRKLRTIPNVKLVHHKTPGSDIMKHAKLITTITGTTGWEASMLGKPVITFGEVFYNALPTTTHVRNIEELPTVMREKLFGFHPDEQALRHFVAAVLKESVPFDFSKLWFENDMDRLLQNPGLRAFCALLMTKART